MFLLTYCHPLVPQLQAWQLTAIKTRQDSATQGFCDSLRDRADGVVTHVAQCRGPGLCLTCTWPSRRGAEQLYSSSTDAVVWPLLASHLSVATSC